MAEPAVVQEVAAQAAAAPVVVVMTAAATLVAAPAASAEAACTAPSLPQTETRPLTRTDCLWCPAKPGA